MDDAMRTDADLTRPPAGAPPGSRHGSGDRSADISRKSRACQACARLKMKCTWPANIGGPAGNSCIRCFKTKSRCHVPQPVQRKKRGKSTRVAQLEEKIDGIVSLLTASQQIQQISATATLPPTPETASGSEHRPEQGGRVDGRYALAPEHVSPDASDVSFTGESAEIEYLELFPGFRLSIEQAELYLAWYRTDFVPNYPFVPMPADIPAFELYNRDRLLFWTIMSVTAPQTPETQQAFKRWFRAWIAEHMIKGQEKKVEILQAILIHVGWGDFHFYVEMQATNLLQLAHALVIDLGLSKPPGSLGIVARSLISDAWSSVNRSRPRFKAKHTLDDMRSVLGCWYITSLISTLFRKYSHVIPFTAYMAHCCDTILAAKQYPTDELLVALVRMQRLADRIHTVLPNSDYDETGVHVFRAPLDMAMASIRKELDTYVHALPDEIRTYHSIETQYQCVLLRLYEPVINMRAPTASETDSQSPEPFRRTEVLWSALRSASSFFTAHLAIPASNIMSLPFTSTAHVAFTVVTATRLLLLDTSADWDPQIGRRSLNFAEIARRMADLYELGDRVAIENGRRRRVLEDGSASLLKYAFKVRWIRQWYLSKLPTEQQPLAEPRRLVSVGENDQSTTGSVAAIADDPISALDAWGDFDFDDSIWQSILTLNGFAVGGDTGATDLDRMSLQA